MLHTNIGLIFARSASPSISYTHFFVTRHLPIGRCFPDLAAITYLAPLYAYPAGTERQNDFRNESTRQPNLSPAFREEFCKKLTLEFLQEGSHDLRKCCGPEDILSYVYAVVHSPIYRERYAEFLRADFPRVPLTSDKELFRALVEKGRELVGLHLMESPKLAQLITRYEHQGEHLVEKVSYDEKEKRVHINKTQYFEGVPKEVWEFHIGGYQVCEKWLKDRKGRQLSNDDIDHYQKIVVALNETIRVMREIDDGIPGWPLP